MRRPAPALKGLALAVLASALFASCAPRPVSPPDMRAYELSLAVEGDEAAVAWHGRAAGLDAIHLQRLDRRGRAEGPLLTLTDGRKRALEPDLLLVGGAPVAAWYERASDGASTAWAARFDARGRPVWRTALSGAGGAARNAIIRRTRNGFAAAWIEAAPSEPKSVSIWVAFLGSDGRPLAPARQVGAAGSKTWNLNGAVGSGDVLYVVFDAAVGARAPELQLIVARPDGARQVRLGADDGHASTYPDIAIAADGGAALVWTDDRDGNPEIYLATAPLADLAAGKNLSPRRLTRTATNSIGAYAAWSGSRLVVVWCDDEPGQKELFGQTFDTDGRPTSSTVRLTRTAAQSSIPSIRADARGALVAWNEYRSQGEGHGGVVSSAAMVRPLPASLAGR